MATMTRSDAHDEQAMTEGEWQMRCDLAALYQITAMLGWDELVATHISARVPETENFLINPFGMMFDEITASSLVKIDLEGNVLSPNLYEINRGAFVIHSAVHAALPHIACVMHLHTPDGVAVSALEDGLLPLNQTAMLVSEDVAIHEFEGVAVELEERRRIVADLGSHRTMLLRNHGTLAIGETIGDCFGNMYFLEWACSVQVRTLGMGRRIHLPSPDVVQKTAEVGKNKMGRVARDLMWPAMLRKLQREGIDWMR